jgi:pyrroloquinoline quinone biosynthesis protein B
MLVDNNNIKINTFEFEKEIKLSNNLSIIPVEIPHRQELSDTAGFIIKGRKRSVFYLPMYQMSNAMRLLLFQSLPLQILYMLWSVFTRNVANE